jgi:uncharacterized membrane protein YpjA
MNNPFPLSYLWSKAFLTSRWMLWLLFWINFLGTIYGYEWYWQQMQETVAHKPLWLVIFVPDSPTGSLFFTIALIYLLFDLKRGSNVEGNGSKAPSIIRGIIESLAVVASFKYGVWAVGIIIAGAYHGEPTAWQDWMLSISHAGMAIEALLFARFFRIRPIGLAVAGLWVFGNDYIDYHYAVFPWLPDPLYKLLDTVRDATILLSLFSMTLFAGFYLFGRKQRV